MTLFLLHAIITQKQASKNSAVYFLFRLLCSDNFLCFDDGAIPVFNIKRADPPIITPARTPEWFMMNELAAIPQNIHPALMKKHCQNVGACRPPVSILNANNGTNTLVR